MKRFKTVQGRKHPQDKILLYNGLPVKFEDVARMSIFFMNNEDVLYPPPRFKGAEMFKEYMREVLDTRKIPSDNKYKIKK